MTRPSAWILCTCLGLYLLSAVLTSTVSYASRPVLTPESLDRDECEYFVLSADLSAGRYQFTPRRTIGFPASLAALRLIVGGNLRALQQSVILIWALAAPLAFLLARRELGDDRAALAAGLGVAIWPPFLRYGGTLYSETIAMPLLIVQLMVQPGRGDSRSAAWRWVLAGALLGLCIHVRTMYQIFAPIAAARAFAEAPTWRRGFRRVLLLVLGALIVTLPWTVAQSLRHGSLILTSRNQGETLAGGLNPRLLTPQADYVAPDGRVTWVGPGKWIPVQETGYLTPAELRLPYLKKDALLTERSTQWIGGNPGAAAYISACKLLYMWGFYPFWNGLLQTLAGNAPTMILLGLAGASMVRLRRGLGGLAVYWTLPIFVSLVALISWGSWRFRQPGDFGLIALAAALPWAQQVGRHLAARDRSA